MNANRTQLSLTNTERCLNYEFLLEQLKNSRVKEPSLAKIVAWFYDMEGHAEKCLARYCELANKKTEQLYKVSTPCLDDHHFKKEELESVGELSKSMLTNCLEMLVICTNW